MPLNATPATGSRLCPRIPHVARAPPREVFENSEGTCDALRSRPWSRKALRSSGRSTEPDNETMVPARSDQVQKAPPVGRIRPSLETPKAGRVGHHSRRARAQPPEDYYTDAATYKLRGGASSAPMAVPGAAPGTQRRLCVGRCRRTGYRTRSATAELAVAMAVGVGRMGLVAGKQS